MNRETKRRSGGERKEKGRRREGNGRMKDG